MTQVPSLPGSSRNSIFFDSVFREAQGRSVGNYSETDKGRTETPGTSARQMTNSIVDFRVGFHLLTCTSTHPKSQFVVY